MKKYIKISLLALVVLTAVSCGGGRRENSASQEAEMSGVPDRVIALSDSLISARSSDTVYMGRVKSGERAVRLLAFENAGNTPWVVTGVDKTCGCVEVDYPAKPLKPGEKAVMTITFDSKGLSPGFVYKTLTVKTSLSAMPFVLTVTADVEE